MSSATQCKEECQRFIRSSLPAIAEVAAKLPTLPKFRYGPGHIPGRYKFHEEKQPNWWQLPKDLSQSLFRTREGKAFLASIGKTPPFSGSIGKTIFMADGKSISNISPGYLANEILVSYLFAAGVGRWKPAVFERVWNDCASYFNPRDKKLEYFIYAPISGMSGVARRLDLGDGLEIRRLSAKEVARIASLNPELAGVSYHHRLTLWDFYFFVQRWEWEKKGVMKYSDFKSGFTFSGDWTARLNEEVAILRSLLDRELAVPTYALVKDSFPRDSGGGVLPKTPWRPSLTPRGEPFSRHEIASYKRRRGKFLELHGSSGWGNVAASMRRFAVAWENPFNADALADIVAALERLVVGEANEVSYKLRVRTAHLISRSIAKTPKVIFNDIRDAYKYRSKVAHGDYIFDNPQEWAAAKRMRRAKGKKGNPFHDFNEINRLTGTISQYYRRALEIIIDAGELEIDWVSKGL